MLFCYNLAKENQLLRVGWTCKKIFTVDCHVETIGDSTRVDVGITAE